MGLKSKFASWPQSLSISLENMATKNWASPKEGNTGEQWKWHIKNGPWFTPNSSSPFIDYLYLACSEHIYFTSLCVTELPAASLRTSILSMVCMVLRELLHKNREEMTSFPLTHSFPSPPFNFWDPHNGPNPKHHTSALHFLACWAHLVGNKNISSSASHFIMQDKNDPYCIFDVCLLQESVLIYCMTHTKNWLSNESWIVL